MACELSSGASEGSGVKLASRTPRRCRRSLGHLHTKPRPGAKHHPEAYRAKHGLPSDDPMTSASYSAQPSELARSLGLGQVRKDTGKAKPAAPEKTVVEEAAAAPEKPKKAGRPR
ncbi:MucR family transcriptional regulator [Methylobacterium sp. CM6247]